MPDIWILATIITKFALYLGVLTATGTVMATLIFGLEHTRALALRFAGLGLIATLLGFLVQGANLTGEASGMVNPEMLGLLWGTSVGSVLVLRFVGLSLLILGLFMGRVGQWFSVLGGGIAIYSFAQIGHVSGHSKGLLEISLIAHLVAVALWIGILTPLKQFTISTETYALAHSLGHRFGIIATITVPALIILGFYMGYHLVGSFSALFGTGYGLALVTKIVLVGVLLGLAAANKLKFIPALRLNDPSAAQQLSRSISFEWVVVLAVLALTAVLTSNLTLPS